MYLLHTYIYSTNIHILKKNYFSGLSNIEFGQSLRRKCRKENGCHVTNSTNTVVLQDVTVKARLQSTRVQTPLSPHLLNVMYFVRVSLWRVKNIPCATLKEKWVVGISVYLWCPTCICRSGAECFRLLGPDNRDLFAHQRVSDIPERISWTQGGQ